MKRHELLKLLKRHGYVVEREGSRHTRISNPLTGKIAYLPRHIEIKNVLAYKILKDLGIQK